jgi:hypothetical protein
VHRLSPSPQPWRFDPPPVFPTDLNVICEPLRWIIDVARVWIESARTNAALVAMRYSWPFVGHSFPVDRHADACGPLISELGETPLRGGSKALDGYSAE